MGLYEPDIRFLGQRPILRWQVQMRLDTSGLPNPVSRKARPASTRLPPVAPETMFLPLLPGLCKGPTRVPGSPSPWAAA